jgi:predicted glycosyltransferase
MQNNNIACRSFKRENCPRRGERIMTVLEHYNVTEEDVKRAWNNTRVKEYYRQITLYGKADFSLETNIEKAVYYLRYTLPRG